VLIAREPCPLHARKLLGKKGKRTAFVPETTDSVRDCVSRLACPAFRVDGEEVSVDENACSGCMVCLQITTDIKTKGTA
jgi:indolepyruvate ferredoxin oxidoreductase alpha subunit